jgi:hypothetical protein
MAFTKTIGLRRKKAMPAINKIPRGLRVLITIAILAVLVWRIGQGIYYYPAIGTAILVTLIVIYFVYRKSRTKTNGKETKNKAAKDAGANGTDENYVSEEMVIESEHLEEEINNIQPKQTRKQTTNINNSEIKAKATDVAAKYMNMAKTAEQNRISDDWQPSPRVMSHKEEIIASEDVSPEGLNEDDSQNPSEPPMPLIDDESSLTIQDKNLLVNAVWYRCENPFCKYTHFLGVHHIIEEKDGGTNKLDNLIVLCPFCHDLAHRKEIPDKEMRDWISNRDERFKFKPEWHYR